MEKPRPFDLFKAEADARCPGLLYSFNIADFKRRNLHLTYVVGDKDIGELDLALKSLASDTAVVSRTHGNRWFLFSARDESIRVRALLDAYRRCDKIWTGWRIDGEKSGERASHEHLVETAIQRAVRCLCARVESADALNDALSGIEKNNWNLPVNVIVPLDQVSAMARAPWTCVAHYPDRHPACPFCGGTEFECEGCDDPIYSGYGTCKSCSAAIDIRQVS